MSSNEGKRDALIVAVGHYADPQLRELKSPASDSAELATVLHDPGIGGFETQVLLDVPGHELREEIDTFFADRRPEDLLIFYLSCHGIKDVKNELHFATSTTQVSKLLSTAISANFVYDLVDRCRAGKILLLLDCCYSGAYLKGHRPQVESRAKVGSLDGDGRAVITSCTALEYSFEIGAQQSLDDDPAPSVFTTCLIEGLRTGNADRDGDGLVSVGELYDYVFERVRDLTPNQTPERKWEERRGTFVVARSVKPTASLAAEPAAVIAGTAAHRRPIAASRRTVLGIAAFSAGGIAFAGWERFGRPKETRNRTTHKAVPKPVALWTRPGDLRPTQLTALSGDVLYVQPGDPGKLEALRPADGHRLWGLRNAQYLAATPDGSVAYLERSSGIQAVHAYDGRNIWQSSVSSMAGPQGTEGTFVITEGTLVTADVYGEVYVLRQRDGRVMWSFATSQGEPSGVATAGKKVFTAGVNVGANVYALSAGNELWKFPLNSVYAGPVVSGNRVFVTTNEGVLQALDAKKGTSIWTSAEKVNSSRAVHIAGGWIYASGMDGSFLKLDPTNGRRIWRVPFLFSGPPIITRQRIYLADQGDVYAISQDGGAVLWRFKSSSDIHAMTIAGGSVYLASNNLYSLAADSGRLNWVYPVEADSVIATAEGVVYLGAPDGKIHSLHTVYA